MQARKIASFGVPYNYSGIFYPFRAMSKTLLPLVKDIEACFGYRPNNCLINYYENGESKMGFHSDAIENLANDTGVIIVSLGAKRAISFQNKHDKYIERTFQTGLSCLIAEILLKTCFYC